MNFVTPALYRRVPASSSVAVMSAAKVVLRASVKSKEIQAKVAKASFFPPKVFADILEWR